MKKVSNSSKDDTLLNNPKLNKGTAFTQHERKKFGLLGKLPYSVESISQQIKRAYQQFRSYQSNSQKSLFLDELYNNNQTLFYKLTAKYLEEILPIIYTPQVATTCRSFNTEYRHPNGAYISYPNRKNLKTIIDNIINDDIKIVVVTDGERVLGIGDQGIGGIHIAKGKLMLYTLLGNIDPKKTLPIVLDVGTNNKKLLTNPLYLGWRHPRITGEKYLHFVDEFITRLKKRAPNILLQWEDFGKQHAWQLLDRYRKKICSFNDDIQGTATVTLAAILAATKVAKLQLAKQPIVIFGAGSAAIGIVKMLTTYLKKEGIKENVICKNIWLVDKNGLITEKTKDVTTMQKPYRRQINELKKWRIKNRNQISLFEVVQHVKPTILLGLSAKAKAFNKKIINKMAQHTKHPIIMPLSNPTTKSEANPRDLIKWTNGKALIATGTPFAPVSYKNRKIEIASCNNALVFPGIGLGIVTSKAKEITDEMFLAAAKILYKKSPCLKKPLAPLLPPIKETPNISKLISKKIVTMQE